MTPDAPDTDTSGLPIQYHYLLVVVIEVLVLAGLAWLAAHYR